MFPQDKAKNFLEIKIFEMEIYATTLLNVKEVKDNFRPDGKGRVIKRLGNTALKNDVSLNESQSIRHHVVKAVLKWNLISRSVPTILGSDSDFW